MRRASDFTVMASSEMSQWQPTSPRGALRRPSRPDSGPDALAAGVCYLTQNLIVIDHPQPAGQTGACASVGFILRKHASFRVYNLSPRCVYSARVWDSRAERLCSFPMEDKRPVLLSTVLAFCEDVRQWLASGRDRVAVVHAGTGTPATRRLGR